MGSRWDNPDLGIGLQAAFRKYMHPAAEVVLVAMLTLVTSWHSPFLRPLMQQTIHAMFDNCNAEPGLEEIRRSRLQYEFGICTASGDEVEDSSKVVGALFVAALLRFCHTALTIGILSLSVKR